MISSSEIRNKYLEFFKSKGHAVIPSASLIPENDPTVLFTTAGMHPLVPYLLGEVHPAGKRLTSVQKCIRTGDIDEVGDNRHLTFFEMLGNWSLGEYFKKDAIAYSFEFLTSKEWLGLDAQRLYVSVFEGDRDAPRDDETIQYWQDHFHAAGVSSGVGEWKNGAGKDDRIFTYPKSKNWWGPAGETGPCGPDTEMFFDTLNLEEKHVHADGWVGFDPCHPNCDCGRYIEIWNDVFMQYQKTKEGNYVPLTQKNVDTGMGLERTTAVLNGIEVFSIDTFLPIIQKIEEVSGKKYGVNDEDTRAMRIIADHIRSATFILGDSHGILPSNVGQGYVLRRLIRRAVRYGKLLGIQNGESSVSYFTSAIAEKVIDVMGGTYSELQKNREVVIHALNEEEKKFAETISRGHKKLIALALKDNGITGSSLFNVYQEDGYPLELSLEEIEKNILPELSSDVVETISLDKEMIQKEFDQKFKEHQELSRTASAGVFKGGLADHSEQVVKYHTATHLMLQALRETLGSHVEQRGSNLTAERLRFDFSHPSKVTSEEIKKVEDRVNEIIKKDLPVHFEILSVDEAKSRGATGIFEDKYAALGNNIKVYFIGDYSAEICGGPHVEHTGVLGTFKIQKEEAVSQGVRRIKATLS